MKAPGEDKWVKITETPVGGANYIEVHYHDDFLDPAAKEIGEQLKTMS